MRRTRRRRRRVFEKVTLPQLESELKEIEEKLKIPIVTHVIPVTTSPMAYDKEEDNIAVNITILRDQTNLYIFYEPELNWRENLEEMAEHELTHRNQVKFLTERGFSLDEINQPHFKFLLELQSFHAAPIKTIRELFRVDLREMSRPKMRMALKDPAFWTDAIALLSKNEIRHYFAPFDVDEAMIEGKDIYDRVRTKEDILRNLDEAKQIFGVEE